jgi:hypothetical protein
MVNVSARTYLGPLLIIYESLWCLMRHILVFWTCKTFCTQGYVQFCISISQHNLTLISFSPSGSTPQRSILHSHSLSLFSYIMALFEVVLLILPLSVTNIYYVDILFIGSLCDTNFVCLR